MRALLRLVFTLILLVIAGAVGYYLGYRAAGGHRLAVPGTSIEIGRQGEKAATEARDEGSAIGKKLSAAGSEATRFLSDTALTTKIKSKMELDDTLQSTSVHVSTSNGIVTLTGTAATRAERQRAVQLARETRGVQNVVDRIEIGR